jgi:exodeoxyribonuclease V alpha subunit
VTLSDAHSSRRALGASGLLAAFNDAGVIAAADVHVARRLCRVLGEGDESVLLAMALAVRGPRLGHVHVDLATIRDTATVEPYGEEDEPVDVAALPWPEGEWADRVAVSRMVSDGPLRLEGSRLYLDRYWREERQVAEDLLRFNAPAEVDEARLADGVSRLFNDASQARAGEVALRRRLAIVAGGPGTGKTTTVARILALLFEHDPAHPPLVALAAPTGKAQARLQEAIATETGRLDVADDVRERILGLRASTLHRLLGWRPDSRSRFRHHRGQRLPHDVVIVDETSMVSLSQMARLAEAIRPDARLILVGDPGQLASVEAGAVLGDVVGARSGPLSEAVAELETVHRHGGAIAELGRAIAAGDADAAIELLGSRADDLAWLAESELREPALAAAIAVRDHAEAGRGAEALEALTGFRVLCAHRREAAAWAQRLEDWLGVDPRAGRFPPGRPLLVTRNDYDLGLYNGDTGVVVAEGERAVAHFERGVTISPARLSSVEDAYAMTVHKAQGSQFGTAAVVLPDPDSRILTRELLYTACTRAQERLILCGNEEAIRAAITRPIARASGLRDRLLGIADA